MNRDVMLTSDENVIEYYYRRKKAIRYLIFTLKYLGVSALFLLFVGPFLMILINSFKSMTSFLSNPMALPSSLSFTNYITAIKRMNFLLSFLNSMIITTGSCVLILLFSSMTAYYFVRRSSRFNRIMFYLMVASSIIPFQAIMIPLVRIYGSIHLLNSKLALIYMYIGFGTSMAVFIYHGFIKGIPRELEETAMIDGCTAHQTFFKIVWPLLKPVTVTISLIDIVWIWNDYLLPYLVLQVNSQKTLPLVTYGFYSTYFSEYSLLMAGLIMTMLPIIIIYLLMQKNITEGILQGAIKR